LKDKTTKLNLEFNNWQQKLNVPLKNQQYEILFNYIYHSDNFVLIYKLKFYFLLLFKVYKFKTDIFVSNVKKVS
jgi:hypothetical protein